MANIRVDLNHVPLDGETIIFKAPCNASDITGLIIYYINENEETVSSEFTLNDANGGDIGIVDNIFSEGAIVKVILDTDINNAYVQNPDTNTYIEGKFEELKVYVDTVAIGKADVSHEHSDYETTENAEAKLTEAKAHSDANLETAKTYADTAAATVKNDLLNGAGDAYDTLKELGDLITENVDAIEALETVAAGKADAAHDHNDLYYTEAEVDEKLEAIPEPSLTAYIIDIMDDGTYIPVPSYADIIAACEKGQYVCCLSPDDIYCPVDGKKYSTIDNVDGIGFTGYRTRLGDEKIVVDNIIIYADNTVIYNQQIFSIGNTERLDTTATNIVGAINEVNSNLASHNHNNTYYTQTQIDTKLASKSDKEHTHTVANISDLTATAVELNYMGGVTSNVQEQIDTIIDAKANWNQNDETALDYVKNRTHYSDFVTFLAETTLTADVDGLLSCECNQTLTEGTTYIVTWDGVKYTCLGKGLDGAVYIGNDIVIDGVTDTGEPFVGLIDASMLIFLPIDETVTSATVSMLGEVVFKLPEKYLPDSIAEDMAAIQSVADAAQSTANEAKSAASTAQSTANEAKSAASTAQSTANEAKSAASTAQSTANNKMDKNNPVGTGSFSMNRKADTVIGLYSHAEGHGTTASGTGSHAEGHGTTASGTGSHAEGYGTTASGANSHAEGWGTTASGDASHAEGRNTTASKLYSHAEGYNTVAEGFHSHAEGQNTTASEADSHAEGYGTAASGQYSHAEGHGTTASGACSHAEGQSTTASRVGSHAEGQSTTASGQGSHAEGQNTEATAYGSHAEGSRTAALGSYSHAEGTYTLAYNDASHAEGSYSVAYGYSSHSESGFAIGNGSHAECGGIVIGESSHTEAGFESYSASITGDANSVTYTIATDVVGSLVDWIIGIQLNDKILVSPIISHDESTSTITLANTLGDAFDSRNVGLFPPLTKGNYSHSEGFNTSSDGDYSHSEGYNAIASSKYQHVQGKYNIKDANEKYAHIVGNGTSDTERSNAHTLDWDGNAWFAGDVYTGGTSQDDGAKLASETYVNNALAQKSQVQIITWEADD